MCVQTRSCCEVKVPLIHPSTAGVPPRRGRLPRLRRLRFVLWQSAALHKSFIMTFTGRTFLLFNLELWVPTGLTSSYNRVQCILTRKTRELSQTKGRDLCLAGSTQPRKRTSFSKRIREC